ncbi:MFS transporter [Saccharolobus solfataricus]|uniref:Multidrug-efflux transporter n=3 Tax=Saccharolobus solfataricus TaxID=2287 RepID=Q97X92_SACS2|nr:MFS transporter [Saccharolobus solfataricus]AAK42050.1 Multidrug-efflux transporter [Saccharolobus solfataricus P2]AKA74736.1 MFS transporter [Saccharolobus solfataricus]AKA77431.1 MFS transporter [Saccharolobus solfataricus]AKA80122.1 MFS transporter [Saccharolobus solfataricus]AZF69202.1 MFS transporter [Saccharolobus solfataricus]
MNKISVFSLTISRILRSLSAGIIFVILPYLVLVELKYSSLILGFIYTVGTFATAILGLAVGYLADLYGRKNSLILVSLFLPLSVLLIFINHSLIALFIASALGGYSATGAVAGGGIGGIVAPIQNALITELTDNEDRTFYFSLFTFLSGISASIGSLVAGFFTSKQGFLFAIILGFLSVLALFPIRAKNIKARSASLKSKVVIGKFSITGLLNGISVGLITPFLIPYFIIVYHTPKSEMSIYTFLSSLIASTIILLAPVLDKKIGFLKSIAITRGIGALLSIIMPLIRVFPISLGIYLILPGMRVLALPIQQRAMTEMVSQDEVGRAMGINQVTRLAASSGSTGLTGYLFSESQIDVPFLASGIIMALNIYMYYKFFGGKNEVNRPSRGSSLLKPTRD